MTLIYVTRPRLREQVVAMVVKDEADLKAQLAAHEASLRAAPYVAKPQRDKSGNLTLHQLNKDWPPYP